MKKVLLIVCSILISFSSLMGQTYCFTAPQGYGAGNTGGGNATPVTVTSQSALQSALTASGNGVIIVSGTINCTYMSLLITNKTVLGLPGARLRNLDQTKEGSGIINIKGGSTNVIFRNIIFEGPGAYDTDGRDLMTIENSTKIWIDHCEFQDGCDGNLDHKGLTDNTTISWCKFTYLKAPKPDGPGGTDDHRFSNLVGSDDSDEPSDGLYSITWQYCWWAPGCVERMTRARNSQLNMVSCYWNSQQTKVALGLGYSDCYVENSVFDCTGDKYRNYGGTVRLTSVGCTAPPTNVGTCPAPSYTRESIPASSVVSTLTGPCGAGATLNVTAAGVVSANAACTSTPTLVLTSGTASQSVSAGTAITNIVYTWGGNATDVTISGLPAGLTSSKNAGAKTITISGTPTATGTYTVTTVQSAGTAVSLTGTITVVPLVAPTLVLTSGSASQSVLTGTAIASIVYTWGGGATDVTVSGLPAGVTATKNAGAKTVTLSGSPTTAGTYNFSIVTVGGSAPTATQNGTITVTNPVILATPGNITATSTGTTATIDWDQVPNATGYVVNFCSSSGGGVVDSWTFPSTTLTAANADANLQVDGTNARFNYIPATTNGALVFANGSPIPDVQGLLFTQTGATKLRLGYAPSHPYLYLNGTGIAIRIPCTSGDKITVVGPASNATAVDRGYSVSGGTLNTTESINVNGSGIMNVAGATGTWVYNATSSAVTITTVVGGMNISSITVSNGSGSTCTEYPVSGGANTVYTVTGLTPSTTYTYQVKATNNSPAETSPYSTSANVTTTAGGNTPPVVSITAPVTNSCVTANATVSLTANATDADGTVSTVQFYNGAALLGAGTKSGNTYTFSWTNVTAGTYTVTAVATDNQTASTTSSPITLKVSPAVSITGLGAGIINCSTTSITLGSSQAGSSYAWTRNTAAAGTGSTLNVTTAGTYGLTVTYANGCTETASIVTVTVDNSAPAAPTVTIPSAYCQNATAAALTATGTDLKWYTVPTNGTSSATAPTPSTAAAGTTIYYVSQTVSGCESPRAQIPVTVNAIPSAPGITSPVTYCQNATAVALTATGTDLKWYTVPTNGTSSSTAPTPSTAAAGTTNHYVSQTVNGCESARETIVVTINAIPGAPLVSTPVTYCQNATAVALTATGTDLKWYTVPTNGTSSSTAPMPSTATAGTTNHYVSQTVNGCESPRATIAVTINATPGAPSVSSPVTYCQNTSAVALTATGSDLKWYTVPTNGTSSSAAPTPSTATAGTTNHYVSQTVSGCESPRATIEVTVHATPGAPAVSSPVTYCQNETATALSANGTGLKWYTVPTNGTSSSTAPTPSTTTAGTTNHYISQTVNGCESPRALLEVIVNPRPTAEITPGGPTTFTQGGSVVLNATAGTGLNYKWYLNGNEIAGSIGSSYTASIGGNFTVGITNTFNCTTTSSAVTVIVTIPTNVAPTVSITAPGNNTSSVANATVTIDVTANDSDGSITKVEIYQGKTLLSTDNSFPYSYTWTGIPAGTYVLTAKAFDNGGASTSSSEVTIHVNTNQPSVVNITSPLNNSTVSGTSVTIEATATDPDGSITKVEFYDGATLIGSSTTQPFVMVWNNPAVGIHDIIVKATDSNGGVTTSSTVIITVSSATSLISSSSNGTFTEVYPNPTSETFKINCKERIAHLWVINSYGEQVNELKDLDAAQQIEIGEELPSGMYVLIVEYASKRREVANIVKTK